MSSLDSTYQKPRFNPFPGLRAFYDAESHLFFGREEHTEDVLEKLNHNHFVAVIGSSGTGKSSLIRAGVLPALLKNDNTNWRVVSMTPGSSPITNLASAICEQSGLIEPERQKEFYTQSLTLMESSSLGMVQALRTEINSNERLLILVDQFEEVFRFANDAEASRKEVYDQFIHLLIDTIRQRDVPIYIILTLRSDFLGDCVQFEGLPEAINDGHYLVPRLNKVQIKRAISGPIELAGGKISPRLMQSIIQDIGDDPDQLPVLQHALMRCWDLWVEQGIEGEPIDVHHFEKIGGLKKALSNHADEAFDELTDRNQVLAGETFKCITTKTRNNRGVRRPMSVLEVSNIIGASTDDVIAAIAPFRKSGRSFIRPDEKEILNENSVLDISHESLMRGWIRLKTWVNEELESSSFYERLCTAALLNRQGESALWRNPELQLALDWKQKQHPTEYWAGLYNDHFTEGIGFLERSRQSHIKGLKKSKKRAFVIRASVFSFLVIVSLLSAWAFYQSSIAREKSAEAEEKSVEAIELKTLAESATVKAQAASSEAIESKLLAEQQAEIALEQKSLALNEKGKAQLAAIEATQQSEIAKRQKEIADTKSTEALLQKQKADSSRTEALRLRMISMSQNLAHESSQINQNPELASLLSIKANEIATQFGVESNDAVLYASSIKALEQINPDFSPVLFTLTEELLALNFGPTGLKAFDTKGNLLDLGKDIFGINKIVELEIDAKQSNTAYFSEDGRRLAIGMTSNKLAIFNEGIKSESSYMGHNGLVRAISFKTDSPELISGGRDSKLLFWENGIARDSILFDSKIRTLSSLPSSKRCLVGCEDGKSYSIDTETMLKTDLRTRPGARVEIINQSENGTWAAIGYSDGFIEVLNSRGKLLKTLRTIGSVQFIEIDQKNAVLVIASTGKTVSVYSLNNLTALPIEIKIDRPIKQLAINPITLDLFVYCSDRSLRRYPAQVKTVISDLQAMTGRELSKDEWNTFIGEDIPYNDLNAWGQNSNMK